MPKTKFTNESTYKNYLEQGKETEFDRLFDGAVQNAKRMFGKKYPMFISGKETFSNETIEERSPIDGTLIGVFQKGGIEHAKSAISAAQQAFPNWSKMDYRERAAIFEKAASLLSQRKFDFAAVLSYENGKSRYESIGEVDEGIDFMRYYASELLMNKGYSRKTKSQQGTDSGKSGFQGAPSAAENVIIAMKPYGVFGVIAPFNFPVSISIGMSTGALITGNTVVFKPSSTDNMTMLTGLYIYQLFKDAGLPDGVFNYVTGPGSKVGEELASNDSVSGIAFTGSRSTGMSMMARCFSSGKQKVFIVEMGGKNPTIIARNADIDKSVSGVASAAFGFAGQKCSALSRVYVHESIKEQFVSKLIEKARNMKIGDPLQKDVYIGPLISESAFKRYMESVTKAKTYGRILYGGNPVKVGYSNCYYVEPVIFEAMHDNELIKRELFLPMLSIETFSNIDDAIRLANDTEYGLTAGFYGASNSDIKKFASRINAGVVYINREISATTGAMVGVHTFVGWKGSAITGKGTGSKFYLPQFMREQSVSITK